VGLLLAIVGNLATSAVNVPASLVPWLWVGLGALAVISVLLEITRQRADLAPALTDLVSATDQLAHAVRVQWQAEEQRRRVHDPVPLRVTWRTAEAAIMDHWANVHRAPAGALLGPLNLAGELDEVVSVYRRIPSGRIVVLGTVGSGKTVLAIRFTLDWLGQRHGTDPVPVIADLRNWNPTTSSLLDWLAQQMVQSYPRLGAVGPDGSTMATALVTAGRVLPVLDGFDELAPQLRSRALLKLNATAIPLLLTSRPDEYKDAVADSDVLTGAAVIELRGLDINDLTAYLPRTTRVTAATGAVSTTKWDPILARLAQQPRSPAVENLTAALSSPLMVSLARTVYSEVSDHNPADLLDGDKFPSTADIEKHLLTAFVPAAYQEGPTNNGRHWPASRAERSLRYLARSLNRTGQRELSWWRMADLFPWYARLLIGGTLYAILYELVIDLPNALQSGDATNYLTFGLGIGLTSGLAFGLVFGLSRSPEPSRTRVGIRGRAGHLLRRLGRGFAVGLGVGTAFGLTLGLVVGFANYVILADDTGVEIMGFRYGVVAILAGGLAFGLTLGVFIGVVEAIVTLLAVPVDITAATSPARLLAVDRRKTLFSSAVALSLSMIGFLIAGIHFGHLGDALLSGVNQSLALALVVALLMNAWGRWLVIVRIWLPLTGRLPWAVVAFLDDACNRGVLRQAGPTYEFRHATLQTYLGTAPPTQGSGQAPRSAPAGQQASAST
jgi:hypothetical protein